VSSSSEAGCHGASSQRSIRVEELLQLGSGLQQMRRAHVDALLPFPAIMAQNERLTVPHRHAPDPERGPRPRRVRAGLWSYGSPFSTHSQPLATCLYRACAASPGPGHAEWRGPGDAVVSNDVSNRRGIESLLRH
jgi:hypothetical protein